MFEKALETITNIRDAVTDFLDPKAKAGVASDPLANLTLPARDGLGFLFEVDASVMVPNTGLGIGLGMISPLSSMTLPPIIRLKTVEDGVHSKRVIDEGTREAMVANMQQQVREHGEIMYLPKVSVLDREKA